MAPQTTGIARVFCCVFLGWMSLTDSYNVDLEHPIVFRGPESSFFGYSVLEHYHDNTRWWGRYTLKTLLKPLLLLCHMYHARASLLIHAISRVCGNVHDASALLLLMRSVCLSVNDSSTDNQTLRTHMLHPYSQQYRPISFTGWINESGVDFFLTCRIACFATCIYNSVSNSCQLYTAYSLHIFGIPSFIHWMNK